MLQCILRCSSILPYIGAFLAKYVAIAAWQYCGCSILRVYQTVEHSPPGMVRTIWRPTSFDSHLLVNTRMCSCRRCLLRSMFGAESRVSGRALATRRDLARRGLLEEKWLLLKAVILLLNNNLLESSILHVCTCLIL